MKKNLLSLVNKLWQEKRSRIHKSDEQLKKLTQVLYKKQRSIFRFLIYLLLGLITSTLFACYMTKGAVSEIPYRTSWIGNTFGGGSKWVQIQINAMYVAPDGTVYTNSSWDEAGREAGIYKDGDAIGMLSGLHGWGREGGKAVAANSKYIYIAMKQEPSGNPGEDYPSSGTIWYCVRRYNLSGEPVPFAGGRGYDRSMLIVSNSSEVTGLAIAGSELYVSDNAANRIRVYDTETLKELRNWAFARPGHIAIDGQGTLWVIQTQDASNSPKILHYTNTGEQLEEQITDVREPTALAVDNQGRLLVTDNGPRQLVLIYTIKGAPALIGTFGAEGGIYSGKRGEVGDLKFYGLTGVGTDEAGNIYVSNDGFNTSGADLRKFSPSGGLLWQLLGLQFIDSADVDPGTDGMNVFTKNEHFVMDYSKSNGKEWSYKAYTVDRFRYPDDARLHTVLTSPFVRRLQGQRFLYLTDVVADQFLVYRFDEEIAVPSAIFAMNHTKWPTNQPPKGSSWLWRDKNGDGSIQTSEYEILGAEDDAVWGWEVDSKGDIWQASESGVIRRYRFQGLDAYGSPIYSGASGASNVDKANTGSLRSPTETASMPAPFNKLLRLKYFPDTDVMYLGGYTVERPHTGTEWGIVGTEIVRYDNWSTTKNMRWRIPLPYNPPDKGKIWIKAMDVAGDRIFAGCSTTAEIYVYDTATGALVMKLKPGAEVAGESGWIDTPYGIRAYRRANGEYLVFAEEVWKSKVIVYRFGAA